jgi:hypothetical protein
VRLSRLEKFVNGSFDGALSLPVASAPHAGRLRFRNAAVSTGWISRSRTPSVKVSPFRLDPRPLPLPDGPGGFPLLERLENGTDSRLDEDVDRFLCGKRPPLSFETPRSMAAIGG